MGGIHPAQGPKSFLPHPDLACDPSGMVTTLCSPKAPKVLGSSPVIAISGRRGRKVAICHTKEAKKSRPPACEPTSCKFLASVLLSCPKYLRWRAPEGQRTLLLKRRRPVQPMETEQRRRDQLLGPSEKSQQKRSKTKKQRVNKRMTRMNKNVESSLCFT